jgi:hypothetical protein
MTITTHTRVQRGFYRCYYQRTAEIRREKAREGSKCRYRRGWANWLIAELIAYWSAERMGVSNQRLDTMLYSQPTSSQWMSYASVGRSKRSTGSPAGPTQSTG